MMTTAPYLSLPTPLRRVGWLPVLAVTAFLLSTGQDLLHAELRNYTFQLEESLLYNTFWLLFLPLSARWPAVLLQRPGRGWRYLPFVVPPLLALLHLLLFALAVWLLSAALLDHTFPVRSVLRYAGGEHVYLALLVYGGVTYFRLRRTPRTTAAAPPPTTFATTLRSRRGKTVHLIPTADILCLTTSRPYVLARTQVRRYPLPEALSALEARLDPAQFVRVHRSALVNRHHVTARRSRGNGDYDLVLSDGSLLRMSRSFRTALDEPAEDGHGSA